VVAPPDVGGDAQPLQLGHAEALGRWSFMGCSREFAPIATRRAGALSVPRPPCGATWTGESDAEDHLIVMIRQRLPVA